MKIVFSSTAWDDYQFWISTDTAMVKRINSLINNIQRDSFGGIGKPEALKHALSGFWSRRINDEHRLVYRVRDGQLEIAQLRFHYE